MQLESGGEIVNTDFVNDQHNPVVYNIDGNSFVFWTSDLPNHFKEIKFSYLNESGRFQKEEVIFEFYGNATAELEFSFDL